MNMTTNLPNLVRFALAASLLAATASFAQDGKDHPAKAPPGAGQLVEPTDRDAAWLAKARSAYPSKVCLVSDEELGGHGDAIDRIYREKDRPDRLVRFCCDSCIDDFAQDPAKYLRKLAAAAAKPKSGHSPHHH
jgi:hypothetical protein